jgi:hypothetical protein
VGLTDLDRALSARKEPRKTISQEEQPMERTYAASFIPPSKATHDGIFHIHLIPLSPEGGVVPYKKFRNREELVVAFKLLRIAKESQAAILEALDHGEMYYIPGIRVPDEIAAKFGFGFD